MPRGYPALNETQKQEIIRRVTDNGEKVSELSKEYGVVSKTIYKLLGRKANQSSAVLELSKLRRENEALLSIIGSLVAESKLGKKSAKKKAIVKHFSSSAQEKEPCGRKSVAGKSAITEQIGISRQNLYYQPRLPAKDLELKNKIEAVILEHKAYGYRRIAIALGINHKRVHRVMKLFGLKARRSLNRQPKVRSNLDLSSTNRHTNLFVKAVVNKPNQAWVSDNCFSNCNSLD